MAPSRRASVQERAGYRCEYCQLHQEDSPLAVLHVEHIIPRIHGGTDDLDNLALACIDCNLHKGPNLTGVDPETGAVRTVSPEAACLGGPFRVAGNLFG